VGKYHPITIIKNNIRQIFHSMGFREIRGPIIETAFYNFDCLYQPQDHPAREMHDTFYLKNPKKGKLPDPKLVEKIKNIHENGGNTGSTGWGYQWSPEIAKQTLIRTHTTATTLRHLQLYEKNKDDLPIKLFCIDRVFRNESVDRTHLAELEQIDGIIIDEHITLSDLIGHIKEFSHLMGFEKVITRPGFFPYTEPSMEISVFSEELDQWIEMGGSGIFRPEVTYAWGIKEPVRVLAWGLGLERLAMLKLKRNDIRDLYNSPIEFLREVSY
jgi:phenylalanyl-tRNA synthetase alpha chain